MIRPSLFLLATLAAWAAGCTEPEAAPAARVASVEAAEAMAPIEAHAPIDPAEEARQHALVDWLAGCFVSDASFARHKLYTWTSAEQVDQLHESLILLSRERAGGGERSLFDDTLVNDDDPLSRHLRRAGHRTRRFAWVTPWATRMGWESNDYGDRLIEVTLREDAWTARFAPGTEEPWRVVDGEGEPVDMRRVMRSPGRIAAVYHVPSESRAFREVVLVNEDQLESWSVATSAIRGRVAADVEQLRGLASTFRRDAPEVPELFDAWLREGWARGSGEGALLERYRGCLALGSTHYLPTAEHLEAIANALDVVPGGEPLEHTVERRRRLRYSAPGSHVFCDPTMGCVSP